MAKYYTLEEAASKLGISDDALKTLIDDGSLKTFMDQGMSKIRAQDVHSLACLLYTSPSPRDRG